MKLRLMPLILLLSVVLIGPFMIKLAGLPSPVESVGIPYATSANSDYFLGTDHLGRSVLSAALSGGTSLILVSCVIGFFVTVIAAIVGSLSCLHPRVGVIVDALADASILIPSVLVIMVVAAIWPGAGAELLIVTCTILGVPYAARVIGSAATAVSRRGWVIASHTGGIPTWSIIAIDILPAIRGVLSAVLGLRIVEALYLVSIASFLGVDGGLGDQAWSYMVRANAAGVLINPAAVIAPALLLAWAAVAILLASSAQGERLRMR